MSHNVIGIHSCRSCQAPLPTDRRRRYCDDCQIENHCPSGHRALPDLDTSKAGRAATCRCERPILYEETGEARCARCGRDARNPLPRAA